MQLLIMIVFIKPSAQAEMRTLVRQDLMEIRRSWNSDILFCQEMNIPLRAFVGAIVPQHANEFMPMMYDRKQAGDGSHIIAP